MPQTNHRRREGNRKGATPNPIDGIGPLRCSPDANVNSLYSVTFGGAESTDFGIPFVASFCSHADQAYESEHGLLSQWRGYGRDGGYCLVFDTAKLSKLLEQEINSNFYVHMNLSDTRYALDGVSVEQLFPELLERCDFFVSRMLKGNMTPAPDDGFAPFVIGATMFKHQGFREEREVRIVAMPGSKALFDHVQAQHNQIPQMSIKQMNTIHSSRGKRRYISLFEGNSVTLPIKRVIVGPSRHQAANVAHAQNLLGKDIAISASATPFVD